MTRLRSGFLILFKGNSLLTCLFLVLLVACGAAATPVKEGGVVYGPNPDSPVAFVSVSSGSYSHCALRGNGATDCSGGIVYDSRSFLPRHQWDEYERGSEPKNARFIDLSVGDSYICGLLDNGTPFCWGEDRYGEASPPVHETFTAISSGRYHTCALLSDRSPVCWGLTGLLEPESLWEAEFTTISSGVSHTCALHSDGSPVCWGMRRWVKDTPVNESFIAISSGGGYSCALRTDGSPVCWGDDRWVMDPPADERFITISSSATHTCALRSDGFPVCWGQRDPRTVPPVDERLIAISSGYDNTCALRLDGSPVCWAKPYTSSPLLPGTVNKGTVDEPSPWEFEWARSPSCRPKSTVIVGDSSIMCGR